jgi:hypothetical protein
MSDPPEELRSMKAEYAFNSGHLKKQFLAVSDEINLDFMLLSKQHNLLLFRERLLDEPNLPEAIFTYDLMTTDSLSNQALKSVIAWPPAPVRHDLATEISVVYPDVDWIVDYFVNSTFPGISCKSSQYRPVVVPGVEAAIFQVSSSLLQI